MKKIIEKFYGMIFEDKENPEEVPYANKAFMFYFSIIVTVIVLVLITLDIVKNFQNINPPTP